MIARSIGRSVGSSLTSRGTAAAGGGPSFSPSDLTGLQLWLDASDSSTVLNSISPDTPATDGQTVRRWLDKSVNGFHADQATAANQPIWRTNQINGHGSLDMDGVNDRLYTTLFSAAATASVFWVLQSSDNTSMLALSDKSIATRYSFSSVDGSASNVVDQNFGSPTYRVNGVDVAWANRDDVHASVVTGNAVIVSAIGCNFSLWSTSPGNLLLGYESVAAASWTDLYSSLLIYDSVLSAENVAKVEQYLANKWGITLS